MTTTSNPDTQVHEVIADIAFTAGFLLAKGKIQVDNSRELMSDIIDWAKKYQAVFSMDHHGEDYMESIEEYAEFCLMDEHGKAENLLNQMRLLTLPVPA